MAWEEERAAALGALLRETKLVTGSDQRASGPRVALLIGLEGGFSVQEAETVRGASVQIAGLGPRILRTETAALVAATVVLWETGGLDG